MTKHSTSYSFPDGFTAFDVAKKLAQFRRDFEYLGSVKIIIPVELEYRLRGMIYDFSALHGVEVDIGLIGADCLQIESIDN